MKADALPRPILMVDDDDDDVVLLTHRLKAAGVRNPLVHFRNGGDAFVYLKQFVTGEKPAGLLPCAMFLDINMNGLSGFDVLLWARQQPSLAGMKIFVLSGANEAFDAQISAKLGADDYLSKFPEPAALQEILTPIANVRSGSPAG